jgi:hypothetical protein
MCLIHAVEILVDEFLYAAIYLALLRNRMQPEQQPVINVTQTP